MNFKPHARETGPLWIVLGLTFLGLLLGGCASRPNAHTVTRTQEPKTIFVLMDGTSNRPDSQTNVWRVHELLSQHYDANSVSIYMEGVGDPRHPVSGKVFGRGMGFRVKAGYASLAREYRPGDRVVILGFSRGAHIARALAGLISYAGLPVPEVEPGQTVDYADITDDIYDVVKKLEEDDEMVSRWKAWDSSAEPVAARPLKSEDKIDQSSGSERMDGEANAPKYGEIAGHRVRSVEIHFLGLWDTVPGSFFKEYGECREEAGGTKGTRYKTNSYPTIRVIAHALAWDEKRKRFRPLLVCDPIVPARTAVLEEWFPGAHSDVGGGYSGKEGPERELPSLSLYWMLNLISAKGVHPINPMILAKVKAEGNPSGLAHWSRAGWKNVIPNRCRERARENNDGPLDPLTFGQVKARMGQREVSIQHGEDGPIRQLQYPLSCDQYDAATK